MVRSSDPRTRYVIVHKEWGVYLGYAMGMGFFSLMECAGQPFATTFADAADAEGHVREWDSPPPVSEFEFVPVECADGHRASSDEMAAAGIAEPMLEPIRKAEVELALLEAGENSASGMRPN